MYKYYFLTSLLLCVILAWAYLAVRTRNYVVTIHFNVDNKNAGFIVRSLKSIELVLGTLNKLSFQVTYLIRRGFRSIELPFDQSPVHVQLDGAAYGLESTQLTIILRDQQHYILTDQDTTSVNRYGNQLHKRYGTLAVYKSLVNSEPGQELTIKIDDLESMASSYLVDLVVLPSDQKKQITIALSHNNPNQAAIFLKSLLKNFLLANPEADSLTYKRLQGLNDSMAMLHSGTQAPGTTSPGLSAKIKDSLKMAVNVITAIMPYAETSAGQFTQIPPTYHLADLPVQQLIATFNKLNQENQHLLSDLESRQTLYQNKVKLIAVKSDLLYALNKLRIQNQDLLAGTKTFSYGTLIQRKAAIINREMDTIDRLPVSITEDSPSAITILLVTILMSMLFPLPLVYLFPPIKSPDLKKKVSL